MVYCVMPSTLSSLTFCWLTSRMLWTLAMVNILPSFSTPGYNEFSIEMLINTLQMNVLLSEAEAYQCKWAVTVNSKGSTDNNIEIDLFQENWNCEIKKIIKSMGANKMHKAISRASKASDGVMKVVEAFENQVRMPKQSTSHTHKSAKNDQLLILRDLRALKTFQERRWKVI